MILFLISIELEKILVSQTFVVDVRHLTKAPFIWLQTRVNISIEQEIYLP